MLLIKEEEEVVVKLVDGELEQEHRLDFRYLFFSSLSLMVLYEHVCMA